jgi:hypothetical protein
LGETTVPTRLFQPIFDQLGNSAGPGPALALHGCCRGLGGGFPYLLARTPGFYPALLEKSDGLLVELFFSTGVLTALEAYFLIFTDFLHHQEATRCRAP